MKSYYSINNDKYCVVFEWVSVWLCMCVAGCDVDAVDPCQFNLLGAGTLHLVYVIDTVMCNILAHFSDKTTKVKCTLLRIKLTMHKPVQSKFFSKMR